jgi:carboxyl-terminal processing protease
MRRTVHVLSPSIAAFAAGAAMAFAMISPVHAVPPASEPAPAPVAPAPPTAPAVSDAERWSDELWDAARKGDHAKVDALLATVPADASGAAATRLRESVARRGEHIAETARKVAEQRAEKSKDMTEAVAAGKVTKALIDAAYIKFLSEDWKTDLASPGVRSTIALADDRIAKARAEGDWLLAEELINRVRSLYEGSTLKAEYQKYDDALETDVSRRVMMVLEYAPRAWYELRKKQYDRLEEKDRKEAFAPFNEKSADDWKQAIEGINDRILTEALSKISSEYLERIGWKPLIEGGLSMVHLLATTPALKENFTALGDPTLAGAFASAVSEQQAAVAAMPVPDVSKATFTKVFAALQEANAATVKLPLEVITREFGNGALATVTHDFEDPYTDIVWPDRMRRFNQTIKGNFVGVGILLRNQDGAKQREIVVVNPLDGSPAKRAGVHPGDKIVAVNGVSTADWPIDKAVDNITGPAGTPVTLTITRESEPKPIDYQLIREKIKMYSVQGWRKTGYNRRFEPQWDWFIDQDSGIGYVRLTGFNEDSFPDFLRSLREMTRRRNVNGLILDLRGNPGGLLESAVAFVNAFVRQGAIVSVEDRDGREQPPRMAKRESAPLADVPTVVLINEGSASASEIVSGALEAHDAAVVIGERSFGKGSVQEVHDIGGRRADAEANVKYTVAHYLLPPKPGQAKGRLVHKKPGSDDWGVIPDYVIKLSPAQIDEINKIRASADDLPEEASDTMLEVPGTAKPVDAAKPSGDGKATDKDAEQKPKEVRDPSELVQKGIDPQLEMAVLILQGRVLGAADKADPEPPVAPARRLAPAADAGKARS